MELNNDFAFFFNLFICLFCDHPCQAIVNWPWLKLIACCCENITVVAFFFFFFFLKTGCYGALHLPTNSKSTQRERERETVKLLHLKLTLNWVTLFNLTGYFHLLCRHHGLCLSSERDFLCCLFQHLSFRSPPHLNNCTHASGFLQTFYCVSIWIWAQSWLLSSRGNGVSLPPRDACLKVLTEEELESD